MKLTLFIIALLSIASITNAETFLAAKSRKNPSLNLSPKEFVSTLKKSDFGKTILNLASLQFRTSGKLDDVLNLLSGLQGKLQDQQADDDQHYTTTSASNSQIISDQSNIVATASANIQAYQQQLADAQSSLSQLQIAQSQLETERDNINDSLQNAARIRASEEAAFNERTKNSEVIVQGLQATITVFDQALQNQVVDQEAAGKISALLDQLVTAFQLSVAQDTQQEAQAVQDYNDYVFARQSRLAEIADQLASIALEISGLQALISQLTDAIASQIVTRDNAQALKDQTIQNQQQLDQRYNSNKSVRASQLQLLASAVSTLSNNSSDAQGYLNQA